MANLAESSDDFHSLDNRTARKAPDNRVSVIDVISQITGKSHRYASNLYNRLVSEERVTQCVFRHMPPRDDLSVSRKKGHTQG